MPLNYFKTAFIFFLCLGTVACGESGDAKAKKANTQVVAKVNDDEISVHQMNLLLARLGNISEEQGKAAAKQILSKLIDQQLLIQQAKANKLDRDPRVLQFIEASKNEILAQAHLEKVAGKVKGPSEQEMKAFYQEHPELFEKRRIFRIQELVIDAPKEKFDEVEAGIRAAKEINKIASWLAANQIPFNANSNVRSAEQLPANLLNQLQPLANGEFVLMKSDNSMAVVHLAASQASPILFDKAKPVIEQYFLNINKTKLVKDEMDALRQKANITLMGEFSGMKLDEVTAEPQAGKAEAMPKEKPKSPTSAESSSPAKSSLDKGLAGM